jgi:hypothetical protein
MKMYYINNGNENGGPFTLEELTTSSCTNNLVWQQGMEDWQYAIDCRTKISLSKNQNAILLSSKIIRTNRKDDKTILGIKQLLFLALLFIAILATTPYLQRSEVLLKRN